MTRQRTLLTAAEFYLFCCRNDGRYELIEGEVVERSLPDDVHGEITANVGTAFNNYSRRRGVGRTRSETGYTLRTGPDTVRGPDVSFVLRPRVEGRGSGFVPGAPDIAVEVVSPSNTAAEVARKVAEYLAAGSQRVWVVYPAGRRVVIHRADGSVISYSGDNVITDEELLPGFSLPLSEIFE
jgi:Uma2 family endonuclease